MSHEIQAMLAEMEDMECIKKTLLSWLKEEVEHGKECFDTNSCGAVSDIIKDMAEAKKECYEAYYYKTVIEAMSKGRSSSYGEGSYGYNHRHMDNGEFASSGRGHIVRGYNHGPYMDQMPYIDAYVHDPNFEENMWDGNNMSMGYNPNTGTPNNSGGGNNRMGNSRNGEIYDNYRNAKRYYQSSKSSEDKAKMEEHCMKYMDSTLKNLKSMWKEADPSLKAKIKKDFGEDMAEILEDSM